MALAERRESQLSQGHLNSEQPLGLGRQLSPRSHGVGTALTCWGCPIAWF